MNGADTANIVYLLVALVIFGGAAVAASRRAKDTGAKGPGAVSSLLIWIALIALVTAIIFGLRIWGALFSMVS